MVVKLAAYVLVQDSFEFQWVLRYHLNIANQYNVVLFSLDELSDSKHFKVWKV